MIYWKKKKRTVNLSSSYLKNHVFDKDSVKKTPFLASFRQGQGVFMFIQAQKVIFHNILNIYKYVLKHSHRKGASETMDICISCGMELSIMERNRAECWECRDTTTEAYTEEE